MLMTSKQGATIQGLCMDGIS